jgi:hypothetical protein
MGVIYVARSALLCKWAYEVGLSKHVFKIGYTEEPVKATVAVGWAGESDWTLVRSLAVESANETETIERLARKEKMIDPKLYPKLKGAAGIFKVLPVHVENHMMVQRALANDSALPEIKLKPADFAEYMIKNAAI